MGPEERVLFDARSRDYHNHPLCPWMLINHILLVSNRYMPGLARGSGVFRSNCPSRDYYGDNFKIGCLTGSGRMMNLFEVAREITDRLTRIFLRDSREGRPVYGGTQKFQDDPHWRDHLLFYEYFYGDNGAGLGASHQTGWIGVVGGLIWVLGFLDPTSALEGGKKAAFMAGAFHAKT